MMDQMPTVAVLMSTYNGEKYIREQLDSIFNQKNVQVKLFVRDDGSKDSTVGILEEYARRFPVEIILDGENILPGESFMRLVYKYASVPRIDYYAFADQDDVWLPDKLSVAVEKIDKCSANVPVLYGSNQYIYTNGEIKGDRYKTPQRVDLISHMTKNTIAGCTFVFNKGLAQLVAGAERPDSRILRYRLHDAWMMLVAITCGEAIYDGTSHMLYRIHAENVVGLKRISLSDKIVHLRRMLDKKSSNIRMVTAKELIRLFPTMNENSKRVLQLYADYKKSKNDRIALLINHDIIAGCQEPPVVFRLKILLGLL